MAVTDFGKKYASTFQKRKENGELKRAEKHEPTVVDDALRQRVSDAVESGRKARAAIDEAQEKRARRSTTAPGRLQDLDEQLKTRYGIRGKTAAETLADRLNEKYGLRNLASEYAILKGRTATDGIRRPEEIALGVMDRPYRDGVIGAIEEEQKPARVIQKPGTIELGVMDRPYREGVVGDVEETTEADDGYNVLEAALANLKAGFANIGANAAKTINAAMEPGRNALVDAAKWLTEHTQAPDMPEDTAQAMKDRKAIGDPVYGYFVNPADRLNAIADAEDAKGGFAAQIGGQVIRNAASQIPNVIIGAMIGGTSAAMQAQEAIRTAGNFGAAVLESARQMAMNPMFQNSVMQMYGARYEDAREAGADAYAAALTATITTLMNSAIEMGGGVENLPFTRATVGEWVKNALSEGKEEVVQQVIDNLGQKLYVDGSIPWYSQEDERAVINPGVLAENALVGTLAGGAMTAPGMAINSALGRYDERQAKAEDAGRYPQITEAESEAAGRTDRYGDVLRGQETIARLAEETVAAQEAERQAEAEQARVSAAAPARTVQTGAQAATESTAAAAPAQARANVPAEVSRAAERYSEDAGVFVSHFKGGDADSYARGFEAMYTAGRVGLKMEQIGESTDALTQGMDEVTKKAIWTAGRNSMMRAVTPGVRRMDTKKATSAQKRQYAMLDAVGKRYGIEFMIVDSIEGGRANGAYSGGRRIVVAADAMDGAIVQAGAHELVHYLKRTDADGYSVLKEVVVGHLTKEDSAFILSEAVKERMAEYAGNGQQLTEEDAIEEIVAEAVPTIFASEESVKAFVGKDKTLAEKVRDFIVKFVKEIREIAEKYMQDQGREEIANLINKADALTEIAETFDRALEAAEEKEAAQDGGEAVFARKRSKDADDVSKWTQDSQFMGKHLSAAERRIFRDTLGSINSLSLHRTNDGEYIIEAGHSLVYTDGDAENPRVTRILTFNTEDGTELSWIFDMVYDAEKEGVNFDEVRTVLESVFGEGIAAEYENGIRNAVQGKNGRGEGTAGRRAGGGNRREVSEETGKLSLNNRSPYGPNQPYDWEGDGTYTSFKSAEEARSAAEEMRMDVETEAFMEWFAGSKVVDEKGEPKIMYHGTSGSGFTQFDTYGSRYGLMGTGSYFTDDPEIAEKYTKKGKGKTPGIYPVYLSIQNPADMDQKITAEEAKAWRRYFGDYVLDGEIKAGQTRDEALRAVERGFEQEGMLKDEAGDYVAEFFESQGFDGITHVGGRIFGGTKHRVYIAFEPTQVKSATGNFGDFSAEDADIRFSLNDTSKAESVFTEEGKAMAPDVQLRSKTVAAYAAKALKTGLTVKMEQQITGVANKILKETGSSYDKSTMIENLKKVIGEYAESGATEETLQALTEMSKAIIEKSSRRDDTLRNQYADLRKKLRETPISLTEMQKQEAANEDGSYGEWRKGLFGAVNLTSDGISLDSLWGELSSQYPDMFPPETGEAEMAGKIKDFALMMRPRYENPYGMDMDGAALEMAMRLQGDMMVVAGAKDEAKEMYGTAAKLRERALNEYKEKLKEQKQKRVADFQKIAADLKKAKAAGDSKAQAAVMSRYRAALKSTALEEAFAEVRATYKEREAQKAENRMRAELRNKVEKRAAELMKMMTRPEKGKRVPTVMQGVVMDVLEALDINGRNAASVGGETVKAQAFRAKVTALREFYERVWNQQSRGEAPDGLDGLMMTISERNLAEIQDALSALGAGNKYLLREMDSQQLKSLNELLKTVKQTAESIGKLWKMKRYASVAQMGDAAIQEMDDRGVRRFTEDTIAGKGRDFLALDMMEPVSYGERLGEAGKEIIQGLMDGEKVKFGIVRSAAEATRKMLKDTKATGYDIGKWRKTIREVKLSDGRTVRMSETQLMSLYLTAKRPQGMKHLLGEGMTIPSKKNTGVQNKILLTQADITKMAGMISDQQRALADRMGRYLSNELAKAGNDVTQRMYLYDAFTEENYWPIASDPNELKTQEPEGERAFNAIVNAGFTKPVNQAASNPVIIMDAFDVFNRHVGEMASYVGYAEVMTDALAWLNYRQRDENGPTGKSVKDSMDKLLGEGGIKYLTKLIQDINGARRGGDGLQFAGVTAWLMRNYKIAAVAGKSRVAIQQPTSIVRAAAEINPVYLLKGIRAGKGAAQEMQKWSSLAWWKANGNYDIGIGKGTDEILWGKTAKRDTVMEKISTQGGLVDPGKMDDWAWARMWSAVKREVKRTRPDLKEGSDEYFRAVAERFEYVVDRTQVVDTVMHRSDIMRSKDGLTRNFTAFRSEPIKSYNMLMRAIMEAGRNPKDKKAYAKVARATAVFVTSSAATAAATALVDAFKNRDDDDELWEYLTGGEFGRDYAEAFLKGFMDNVNLAYSIPYIGEALEAIQGEDVTMMQFDGLSGIYKAATTFYDHFFGENKKKTTVWGGMKPALTTISQLAGLPVSGLMANAEILLRIYDPKLMQVKNDMQTTKAAYEKLYEATVGGDKKTALSIRTELAKGMHGNTPKNPKEIDTGVARILAATDERILKAWQMREQGNQARELAALHKEIQKGGFTDEQTKYAVNNVENIMNGEYESLMEEGKKQEAEAIRAKMAKYGMEPEEPEEKDMTEELEAKTYQYKHLFAGIRNGDTDDVAVIAEVMEAESDAEDPAKSIRGEVSGEFRKEYVALVNAGKTREAEALAKKLAVVGIDSEDIEGWVKDDSYEGMKEYVAAGNVYGAREAIDRAIENGATVSGVVSSLNSRFRQEYVDLVMAGRNAEADRMAEVLQELGLYYKDGRTNYFRQSKLNEWVKEAEKKE